MPKDKKKEDKTATRVENLQKILALNNKINSTLNIDELLTIIMETSAEVMQTEVASLLLLDEESQELIFRVALGDIGSELVEKFRVKMGEGIAGSVAQSGKSETVNDTSKDPRFAKRFDDDTGFQTKGILCVPMRAKGKIIGVLEAINPLDGKLFTESDLEFFEVFADQAAIAVENAKMHAEIVKQEKAKQELQIASQIQMNFLPDLSSHTYGIDIMAKTIPARTVGGDFYDVSNITENKVGILISDVSGKGVPAALFMVSAISHFRYLAPRCKTAADLLNRLNESLAEESTLGMFMTTLYLVIHKQEKKLEYASAGHHAVLKRDVQGKTEELENIGGIPLGMVSESEYVKKEIAMNPGDAFFLYTDGIVEARDKEGSEYTIEKLKRCVAPGCPNAKEYLDRIFKDMETFSKDANQHDDMTTLVVTIPQ